MIRLVGAALLLTGGWGISALRHREGRKRIAMCADFLCAAEYLERVIRCECRPLRAAFRELSEDGQGEARRFFCDLLCRWKGSGEENLSLLWEECCAALPTWEGDRLWRELGRRLDGDRDSLLRALTLAAEELTALGRELRQALPARARLERAVSLSASAFLTVLLL